MHSRHHMQPVFTICVSFNFCAKESTKTQSYKSRRDESRGASNPLSGFKNMGTMKNNWG